MTFWSWLKGLFGAQELKPAVIAPAKVETTNEKILRIARGELGIKETRGGETPRILEYDMCTTLKAKEDEVPWCAAFVCWVLTQAGVESTHSAAAISYRTWGVEVPSINEALPGDIIVRSRTGGNHVHILEVKSTTPTMYTALGGNQSDAVTISTYSKNGIIAIRRAKV